jgi:hypothetical protein
MYRALPFGFVLLAGCAAVPLASAPVTGARGGEHVGLGLTLAGGSLEYDCAAGTLTGPLITRGDGTFTAKGMHTPGHGGPDIEGQVPPSYPVRYNGSVRGNIMILEGRADNGVVLGPFTLRRGAQPMIFRCLGSGTSRETELLRSRSHTYQTWMSGLGPRDCGRTVFPATKTTLICQLSAGGRV